MRRLETAIQRYAWGKSGSDSMVADLKKVRLGFWLEANTW